MFLEASEHEPPDTALAAELGGFRKLGAALVAKFGHLALGYRCRGIAIASIVSGGVLVEASRHVVGAASMVRIFAI